LLLASLTVVLAITGCAHRGGGRTSSTVVEQVLRDVCLPFVVDEVEAEEALQRAGWQWRHELPDPFTPAPGPRLRGPGARLELVDGRQQRDPGGARTRTPIRTCNIWLETRDEDPLIVSAQAALAGRDGVVLASRSAPSDPALRAVACLRWREGWAVVRTSRYADGRTGIGVFQTRTASVPPACLLPALIAPRSAQPH
jgi:hypothetical protein